MVDAGRQGDFGAQVRRRNLEAQFAVMLGHHPVHRVGEDDIGFARGETGFDQLLEQAAGIHGLADRSVARRYEVEFLAIAHRFHEGIGYEHTVMQVQRLAVEVPAGFADFEEFLDLGVSDIDVASSRTAAQATLADRESQRIHHPDEGNDAAGLAVEADRFADTANIPPVRADAAAFRGEPDVFVPCVDDTVEAV